VSQQFSIPPPYRAWCHLCPDGGLGFKTLEEIQEHMKTSHSNMAVKKPTGKK
jgi:hypothetical protein